MQQNTLKRDEGQLGRYQLLKRIGRGGMGEVWLAEDPQLHRQVAIKMLPLQKQYDEKDAALFEREAQVVASLNHPHVLPVHDYGEQRLPDGQVINYLVMPYISGGSLGDLIGRRTATGEGFHYREALAFLLQAADAIDYAHAQGMIHRDIKPANMLLRSEESLLLADFGIALMVSRDDDAGESEAMIGTPLYIAPEQAQGRPAEASDLYSLAVIAYQFITGRPPFQAETSYATIVQHIVQAPPSPLQWHPDLPEECIAVLLRGLAKKPEERYATAREFVMALIRSLGAEDLFPASPLSLPSTIPTQESANKLLTRRNLLIGTGTAAGIAALSGGIWAMNRRTAPLPITNPPPITKKKPAAMEQPAMVLRDSKTPPKAMVWQPGANILATSCFDDGTVKLWNIDAFRVQNLPVYESTYTKKGLSVVEQLAWSQDGKYLAVINGHDNNLVDTYIDIFSADLQSQLAGFEQGIKIHSPFIKGLGWIENRYLVAAWDGIDHKDFVYIGMWDSMHPELRPQAARISGISSVLNLQTGKDLILSISPDGTSLAIATSGGVFVGKTEIVGNQVIWKETLPARLPRANTFVQGAIWANDGKRLLGVSLDVAINYVFGWDLTAKPTDLLRFGIPQDATDFTYIVAYPKADKSMFAAGTADGKIYIWDGQTKKLPVRTLISPPSVGWGILSLAWSNDGQWLAASYGDVDVTILIWKI